jgi:hypothetical protein
MKHFLILSLALINDKNLLCNHGENFNVDSIELIETTPRAASSQTYRYYYPSILLTVSND